MVSCLRWCCKESVERINIEQPGRGNPETGESEDCRLSDGIACYPKAVDERGAQNSKGFVHCHDDEEGRDGKGHPFEERLALSVIRHRVNQAG